MKRTPFLVTAFLLGASALATFAGGCELISAVDRDKIGGTGGGTGGATSSSGAGSCSMASECPAPSDPCKAATCEGGACGEGNAEAGATCTDAAKPDAKVCDGNGSCVACVVAADCQLTGSPCIATTCEMNTCGTMNVPADTPAPTQNAGDCKQIVCDGSGNPTEVDDDTDLPNDDEVCTTDTCAAGMVVLTPVAANTDCSAQGPAPGKFCGAPGSAGEGKCVECNDADGATQCPSKVCQTNLCVPASCLDNQKNGDETDTDCGGACPQKCMDGQGCGVGGDCESKVCDPAAKTCSAPSCTDAVQNGSETDVDCGGSCASQPQGNKKCSIGQSCGGNNDCASAHCEGGACVECAFNNECASKNCVNNACAAATCMDGILNQDETGTDCGGATCKACNGGACAMASQCASNQCADGVCCDMACTADCSSCNIGGKVGTCSPVAKEQTDGACTGTQACDGAGQCKAAGGQTCAGDTDCASGKCLMSGMCQ